MFSLFLCKYFLCSWAGSTCFLLCKWSLGLSIFHLEDSFSCLCNFNFLRSQQYCLKLSHYGCFWLILSFECNCSLLWFYFYWINYCKRGSFGNVSLTDLKGFSNFWRNIFVERLVKTCNFSLMLTMFFSLMRLWIFMLVAYCIQITKNYLCSLLLI